MVTSAMNLFIGFIPYSILWVLKCQKTPFSEKWLKWPFFQNNQKEGNTIFFPYNVWDFMATFLIDKYWCYKKRFISYTRGLFPIFAFVVINNENVQNYILFLQHLSTCLENTCIMFLSSQEGHPCANQTCFDR